MKKIIIITTVGVLVSLSLILCTRNNLPVPQAVEEKKEYASLYEAVEDKNIREVQRFLSSRADIHKNENETGWTPLHQAAAQGSLEIVELLIKLGTDIDEESRANPEVYYDVGETPLMVAAAWGQYNMVKYLVEHDAQVNKTSHYGDTSLHYAVRGGDKAVVSYLLEHGADVHAFGNYGNTPVAMLLEYQSPEILVLLLSKGADINATDENECTHLIRAISEGDIERVRYLIKNGADVKQSSINGNALHSAAASGNVEIARLVLSRGAPINEVAFGSMYYESGTPLAVATRNNRYDMVNFLIAAGADPLITDEVLGETPYQIAVEQGYDDIAKLLSAHEKSAFNQR